jgi:hypothetical protein
LGGIGIVAVVFLILGVFMPILWIPLLFLPICAARSGSLRSKSVVRTCAIIAGVALLVYIVIAVIFAVLGAQGKVGARRYGYGYDGRYYG